MKIAPKINQAGKRICSTLLISQTYILNPILTFNKLLLSCKSLLKIIQKQSSIQILFSQLSQLSLAEIKLR